MILTIRQRVAVVLGSIATLAVIVVIGGRALDDRAQADVGTAVLDASPHLIAAAARIEPTSEEIEIGAAITGLLKEVSVKEGDIVHRGDVVAVVENGEYEAELMRTEAFLRLKQAGLRRIVNGARQSERDEAAAEVRELEAVLKNAESELDRRRAMYKSNVIPREELESGEEARAVAEARLGAAAKRYALVSDPAREEDVAIAEAEVAEAKGQRDAAAAALAKTLIRSPIDGTVLKVHRHAGELLTVFAQMPIMTVGDVSRLNARADVDETDVSQLHLGQRAYVMADAYGDEKFWGRVLRIGHLVGKKNVHTDEPTERVDTKVLETLIELDSPNPLIPGLRVDAFILPEFQKSETPLSPES